MVYEMAHHRKYHNDVCEGAGVRCVLELKGSGCSMHRQLHTGNLTMSYHIILLIFPYQLDPIAYQKCGDELRGWASVCDNGGGTEGVNSLQKQEPRSRRQRKHTRHPSVSVRAQ